MTKPRITIAAAIIVVTVIFVVERPIQTQGSRAPISATRDAATTNITGELLTAPGVAILVGTQGSTSGVGAFRGRTLIGCDQNVSRDLKGPGGYGLASAVGRSVRICSYSISNGSTPQDVQFVYGTEASSGQGYVCSPGSPVSAKFHLAANQFVSQGSGIGSLFTTPTGEGLCLRVFGGGDVGVNVTYAGF